MKESDESSQLNHKYQMLLGKVNFEGTDQYYLLDSQSRKYIIEVKLSEDKSLKIQKIHKRQQKYCNSALEL